MFSKSMYNKYYIFLKKWGIYILDGGLYQDYTSQRSMCKVLKGGYFVVRGEKKHELARGDLKVGFINIEHDNVVITQNDNALRIEFWTEDRRLVYWTDL